MQYLLSEQEYGALKREKQIRTQQQNRELQEFCTLAAEHIPVTVSWRSGKPEPWGCILSRKDHSGYCDECPTQRVCPNENKEWSK